MEEIYERQVKELQKLKFEFYLAIAESSEPLTYSFVDKGKEHQCEVFFTRHNHGELEIIIAFDSQFEGRFKPRNKNTDLTFRLNKSNEWEQLS